MALGIVEVEGGLISGVTGREPSAVIFIGILYIAPPVGNDPRNDPHSHYAKRLRYQRLE